MKLLVITHVPDPDAAGLEAQGNLAAPLGELWVQSESLGPLTRLEKFRGLPVGLSMALRRQVFTVGELLVVDESGREMGGRGRKPEKWGVRYSTFHIDDIRGAVAVVQELAVAANGLPVSEVSLDEAP